VTAGRTGGLHKLAPDLSVQDGDRIHFKTIPFDTRATLVRLPSGKLWLHSPVRPTDARIAQIAAIGPVAHIIAPNPIHGAYTAAWQALFPSAQVWVSPKFVRRHPEIAPVNVLHDSPPDAWEEMLDQAVFRGNPILDEVEFYHRPSRTLIVTDILQRHDPTHDGWFWRMVKRVAGVLAPDGGLPLDLRWTTTGHAAARQSIETVLGWDFDRVILAHDLIVESGGKALLAQKFRWLMR